MKVLKYNDDEPHRCPSCHTVAVSTEKFKSTGLYECCRCGRLFARFPRLWRILNYRGVRCDEHGTD